MKILLFIFKTKWNICFYTAAYFLLLLLLLLLLLNVLQPQLSVIFLLRFLLAALSKKFIHVVYVPSSSQEITCIEFVMQQLGFTVVVASERLGKSMTFWYAIMPSGFAENNVRNSIVYISRSINDHREELNRFRCVRRFLRLSVFIRVYAT